MAITVKHSKVSTIPDGDDSSLIRPSDWNDDHTLTGTVPVANGGTSAATLTGYVKGNGTAAMTAASTIPSTDVTGLGTMSTQNANNVTITGGSISGTTVSGYIPTTEKAVANGVATLDGSGTVPISQLPSAVLGALSYQGTWNASTNTPTLVSSSGTKGYYYVVSVAGSTNLNGITDWQVGDWAVYNGSAWQKIDNTDAVTSVNGYTGTVVLTTTDVAEGTNQYFTTARARTSVSAGTGISYNSTTGVITNSSPSLGGDVVGPASATDNAIARFDTTTGKLIQNSVVTIDDNGNESGILSEQFSNGSAVTLAAGKLWYNGSDGTFNMGMGGGNITQQVGEELFRYGKASAAITDSPLQLVYKTGVVGASGNITFAPAVAGITDYDQIIGCATENIALNAFGRVTTYGVIHNITTNGTAYGETWADNDDIYYNPTTGGLTKTLPSAPNLKLLIGTVINAGSGGSGSFIVKLGISVNLSRLSDTQITSATGGQLLTYNQTGGYWKNTSLSAGTGISVTPTTGGAITVANTGVTSVTGTSPVVSSGGTTPAISMPAATTSVSGYLTSTDWNTFNGKGSGSVTSVSGTGSVNGITLTGTVTTTGSLTLGGTLGSIANSQLTNSSITVNGTAISLGASGTITATATNALTIGTYLTGTSYNGSAAVTIAADATSANTASKLVARDASGNFSAGVITATSYVGVSGGTF
jgi:hypothetical protein